MNKKILVITSILLWLLLIWGFVYFNKDKFFNQKVSVDPATISTEWEKKYWDVELPRGIESVTQEINSNSLSEISKTVQENAEKKLAEENAKTEEYSVVINNYMASINRDEDILHFISEESLKKIQEMTKKRYQGFSEEDRASFISDLNDIWYDIKSFNPDSETEVNNYINFILKWGIKSDGKAEEIENLSGKYDEKTGNFCGKFVIKYEGGKSKDVESLCINKDKKFLIHSL